jgi:uncharacterized protein YjiS (DUF1127 family)
MLVRLFGAIFRGWRERRQRKAAIRDLRALNDRTLKDMGLTRGEIVAAVHGQVYRGEPGPDERTPPSAGPARVQTIDPAELQAHLDRARQRRAEFMVGMLRLGFGRALRLFQRSHPIKETRDVRRSKHAA